MDAYSSHASSSRLPISTDRRHLAPRNGTASARSPPAPTRPAGAPAHSKVQPRLRDDAARTAHAHAHTHTHTLAAAPGPRAGKPLEARGGSDSPRRKRSATVGLCQAGGPPQSMSRSPVASPSAPLRASTSQPRSTLAPPRLSQVPTAVVQETRGRTRSASVSASGCPEPRGPTVSCGVVTMAMAEGEVGVGVGARTAGEVLVDLKEGRVVSSATDCDGDVEIFLSHPRPPVFDCTMPVPLPDPIPSQYLATPLSSPSYRSPLLGPTALRSQPPPIQTTIKTSFESSRSPVGSPAAGHDGRTTSPTASCVAPSPVDDTRSPSNHRTREASSSSTTSTSLANKDDKRRRRGSTQVLGPLADIVKKERPSLHTYTSFEVAFDIHPPPSPPLSPKAEGRGWWG